jgi:hypothetical protein
MRDLAGLGYQGIATWVVSAFNAPSQFLDLINSFAQRQVGTNSVLRDIALEPHVAELHEGLVRLKATGADVVLIDPTATAAGPRVAQ